GNELVGPMIHEFNNFLNTTALQMAVLETEVPEKALPDLSVIRNQSNAVARVIKHFQRYRDEQRPPAAPVDLNRVAQAAAEYWQRGAGARRAEHAAPTTVRLEPAGHSPCVIAGVNSEVFCLVHFLLSQVAASLPATEQGVRLRTVSAGERVELHVEGLSAGPKEEAAAEHDEPLELAACRSLV